MLPVQRGDSLPMSAFASYQAGAASGKTLALAGFLSSLFNATARHLEGKVTGTAGIV